MITIKSRPYPRANCNDQLYQQKGLTLKNIIRLSGAAQTYLRYLLLMNLLP
jgi:hypothetical protein